MKTKEFSSKAIRELANILHLKDEEVKIKLYDDSSGVQYELPEFFAQYNPEEVQKGHCNFVFRVDSSSEPIATFKLRDMYDCCGVVIASDLNVIKKRRNLGIGTLLLQFMTDFSSYYGYGIIQAADRKENEFQRKMFIKLNWTKVAEFNNKKTGSNLELWVLKLNQDEDK